MTTARTRAAIPVALLASVGGAISLAALSGCSSSHADSSGRGEALSAADFLGLTSAAEDARPAALEPAAPGRTPGAPVATTAAAAKPGADASRPASGAADAADLLNLSPSAVAGGSAGPRSGTAPDAPDSTFSSAASQVGGSVIVESKVGQINGRPVLASQILEPLDGRLRALATQNPDTRAWLREARPLIQGQLVARIKDELVLAEAQSNLTREQRQGLLYFLGKLQENIVSAQGGSALQADEALQSTTGRSLREEAQDRLDRELIEFELRSKITPRVVVPWRQVRLEYDRQIEKYQPPSIARFNMIWVNKGDAEAIARVKDAIAAGQYDRAAASADNQFLRDKSGEITARVATDLASTEIVGIRELNDAARMMSVGQVVGPLETKDHAAWIRYSALDKPESVSLYEAQVEIERGLRERKFRTESDRYFVRLLERGSFSNIEAMTQLLLEIAAQRYIAGKTS